MGEGKIRWICQKHISGYEKIRFGYGRILGNVSDGDVPFDEERSVNEMWLNLGI